MFRVVIGVAIGYVLGSRAGRERYEQIVRLSAGIADNPAVQGAAGFLRAKATNLLPGRRRSQPARPDTAYLFDEVEQPPTTLATPVSAPTAP